MDKLVTDFVVASFISKIVNIPSFDQRIRDLLDLEDVPCNEKLTGTSDVTEDCSPGIAESQILPSLSSLKFDQKEEEKDQSFNRGAAKRKNRDRCDTNSIDTVSHSGESCSVQRGNMPPPSKQYRQGPDDQQQSFDADISSISDKLLCETKVNTAMPALESVFCSTPAFESSLKNVMREFASGQHLQTAASGSVLSGSSQSCKDEICPPISIFSKFDHCKSLDAAYSDHDTDDTVDVIKKLVRAQAMYCTETPKPDCEEWVAYRKKQEDEFRRKQSIIPKPNLQETVKLMANNSVICFEKVVRESTMFCKKIPGFKNLDLEDKIALIKESRQETQVPSLMRSYHTEMKIASPVPGYNFIVEDVMHLMPDKAEDMFECVREHAQRDIWRTITDEEEALLKAIVFTDADRCPTLKNRDKVIRLHRHMIACLEHFLETTFKDDAPARKREIDYMLQSYRYFSVSFHNYMKEKLLQIPGHAQNQTLNEVML